MINEFAFHFSFTKQKRVAMPCAVFSVFRFPGILIKHSMNILLPNIFYKPTASTNHLYWVSKSVRFHPFVDLITPTIKSGHQVLGLLAASVPTQTRWGQMQEHLVTTNTMCSVPGQHYRLFQTSVHLSKSVTQKIKTIYTYIA